MKKFLLVMVFAGFCIFALSSVASGNTSCTLTIVGSNAHGISYEVKFEILDAWNSYNVAYASSWLPCIVGTNSNFTIPLDVTPDCDSRWVVKATVRQLYNGTPTGKQSTDFSALLTSDEYYDPSNLIFYCDLS
jgi:hypothetical protein